MSDDVRDKAVEAYANIVGELICSLEAERDTLLAENERMKEQLTRTTEQNSRLRVTSKLDALNAMIKQRDAWKEFCERMEKWILGQGYYAKEGAGLFNDWLADLARFREGIK